MRVIHLPLDTYAFSVQLGPVCAIVVGRYYSKLSTSEQRAVLCHEEGHIVNRHTSVRLRWLFHQREVLADLMHAQEFEADAYAVERGHSMGLLKFLNRFAGQPAATLFHPSTKERVNRILLTILDRSPHA